MATKPRWLAVIQAAFVAIFAAPAAWAGPILVAPPIISGLGEDVKVVFAFASAADQSEVFLSGAADTPLFLNNDPNYSLGYTVDLGVISGPLVFGFHDLTTGMSFLANAPAADGYYHALYTTDFHDIVPGPMDPVAAATLASLSSVAPVLFIGFEDRLKAQGSDFDYNDIVIAVTNVDPPPVPEPTSFALVCAGLAGFFLLGRRFRV